MGRRVATEQIECRVRERRLAFGLSQQQLARRSGLTRQAVSGIEAGHYLPNTAVALRLAAVLGCRVEELFQLPDERPHARAELTGALPAPQAIDPIRVRLARVGDRLLARPVNGGDGPSTPADGLARLAKGGTSLSQVVPPADVELLADPTLFEHTVVVLGCDPALALLSAHLSRRQPEMRLIWDQAGSLAALRGLARGEAHAAGSHLRDPDTGEENLPFVRRELAGQPVQVITLCRWQQGLIVATGNPKGIHEVADLPRPGLVIVNREPGSGSRTMLDEALDRLGLTAEARNALPGYQIELPSHLAVAQAVASGAADTGPGIRAAASAFGLDFIPLRDERYDLVIPDAFIETPALQAMLETAVSPAYRAEVDALGGYDPSPAGTVVASID
ncbi:MAG TPA: substrate-binding domain-containing protein [Thermomicrobiaceae bacterium]|nr:substrate-binding domain-containing protein [Thermomicrobiaceae bacterium]